MITRSTKLGLLTASLLALAPTASWAQIEGEGEGEGEATESTDSIPAETEPVTTADTTAEVGATPRYPREVIMRPLTLPGGVFAVGDDTATDKSFDAVATGLVAGYGINDKLEAALFYAFALKEFEAKGTVDAGVGYAAIRGAMDGKLEVVARAQLGYDLVGEGLRPLGLGAQAQYNVSDKLCIITPGGQLQVALEEDASMATPITFGLPVAAGFQATPELYLQLDTTLATFSIADSANAFIFADATPAKVTAVYNVVPAIDVAAAIGLDLTPPDPAGVGDTLAFLLGVRYYGGDIK